MRKSGGGGGNLGRLLLVGIVLCCFCFVDVVARSPRGYGLPRQDAVEIKMVKGGVVLDNKLVQVTFSRPGGDVTGIRYGGIDNLLETKNEEGNRGYWDVVWNTPGEAKNTQNKYREHGLK
ncbi:hypothetical protein ACLB2K_005096 [Fragaria x ananassa]